MRLSVLELVEVAQFEWEPSAEERYAVRAQEVEACSFLLHHVSVLGALYLLESAGWCYWVVSEFVSFVPLLFLLLPLPSSFPLCWLSVEASSGVSSLPSLVRGLEHPPLYLQVLVQQRRLKMRKKVLIVIEDWHKISQRMERQKYSPFTALSFSLCVVTRGERLMASGAIVLDCRLPQELCQLYLLEQSNLLSTPDWVVDEGAGFREDLRCDQEVYGHIMLATVSLVSTS